MGVFVVPLTNSNEIDPRHNSFRGGTKWRWAFSFLVLGIVPFTVANLIGIRSRPPRADGFQDSDWVHGWPVRFYSRYAYLHSGTMSFSGSITIEQIRAMEGPTSRWPVDSAGGMCLYGPMRLVVVSGAGILIGVGVACRNSLFVSRGAFQVSLRTLLITMFAASITLIMHFRLHIWGWESWLALPAFTCALVGYGDLVGGLWTRQISRRLVRTISDS